ncbi:hypothetical protein ACUNWD_12320 [Sunxiuqinia sp. A32]|uniref:hypothetical protein n=1 Tax=Sunxiuqinia sp. A32 TaxID=3461496 RepID=UPI004045EC51
MRKFAAHYVFSANSSPIAKGIVKVDNSGMILGLTDPGPQLQEEAGLEFHNGIICPSFLNLLEEFPPLRFFKLFPELKPYQSLIPTNTNGEKAILEWMKQIHLSGAKISLEQLIRIFTYESAKAIELLKETGSISEGKRPGILVISSIDFQNMRLTANSHLKRLI